MKDTPLLMATVLKKTLIVFPFLLLVYTFYGMKHEHGDGNAAFMYPLVFSVTGLIISAMSYTLYMFADELTYNNRLNPLKNFVHLIFGIGLFWLPADKPIVIYIVTLGTILAVNLLTELHYYYLKRD